MSHLPKHMPQLISVMTPFPHSINTNASLLAAQQMMHEHNIHHLPVIDDEDNLEGIISNRDLQKAITLGHSAAADLSQSELVVRDICSHPAICADVSDPMDKVLSVMVELHLNAILGIKDGELAGIFTEQDACTVLQGLLGQLFPPEAPQIIA